MEIDIPGKLVELRGNQLWIYGCGSLCINVNLRDNSHYLLDDIFLSFMRNYAVTWFLYTQLPKRLPRSPIQHISLMRMLPARQGVQNGG